MKKLSGYNFLIILIVSFLALLSFDFITQKAAFEKKSQRYTNIKKRSETRTKPRTIIKRETRIKPRITNKRLIKRRD